MTVGLYEELKVWNESLKLIRKIYTRLDKRYKRSSLWYGKFS